MALLALMLCSLLLQIQTVFACQMMGHSGSIEHCCCDEMASNHDVEEGHSACCDIGSELTIKTTDADTDGPAALSSHTAIDPLPATLVFMLATLWPNSSQSSPTPLIWDQEANPGHPGTQTWLATLRLRI